ncbi:hypothetical protein HPB51_004089 [Rhipicephalus microplus]|uniref:Uncharacterized protein n=1 Tax=Rhipicephalus microplus TaxID=6941 RepID=A0A9J6EQP1_RHIMP|nr:hypothetical protein HPB51_004089 [Rhipicephalus microplus]
MAHRQVACSLGGHHAVHLAARTSSGNMNKDHEANGTLKELQLHEWNFDVRSTQVLAKTNKSRLRSLRITEGTMSVYSMQLPAAILRTNVNLEEIQLSGRWPLPFAGIAELCSTLAENDTLKKLVLGKFRATKQKREALAQTLATNDSYGRVQLAWANPDVDGLWKVLTSLTACLEEVHLQNTHCLTEESLGQLFDAIALKIGTGNLANSVVHALSENVGIDTVMIAIETIKMVRTARDMSHFLVHNKAATSFSLTLACSVPTLSVKKLSNGMWQNRLIVDFRLSADFLCNNKSFTFFEAVRRNKAALNRAVDFMLQRKADRECAEAFELFSKMPRLISHVVKVTGKTEGEVSVDVASAANFMTDNYLMITKVVWNFIECHPAEGTQIAALSKDCWRAICRHLRVADVLVP